LGFISGLGVSKNCFVRNSLQGDCSKDWLEIVKRLLTGGGGAERVHRMGSDARDFERHHGGVKTDRSSEPSLSSSSSGRPCDQPFFFSGVGWVPASVIFFSDKMQMHL